MPRGRAPRDGRVETVMPEATENTCAATGAVADSVVVPGTLWRLALFFIAHALGTATITLVVALAPSIEDALGVGHAGFGAIVSSYYGAVLVLALPAGWLVDRFGLRATLIAANALLALGMWVFATAAGLPGAATGLMLCGAGYALINPATARGVLMWFPMARRATAMSVKQTGVPAGGIVMAMIAGSSAADFRELALIVALVTVVVGIACSGLRAGLQPASARARFSDLHALLRLPRLALFNIGLCLYAAAQAAFFAYLVLFARDALSLPARVAAACLAIAHAASAIGRIGWGVLSDRLLRNGRIVCLIAIGLAAAIGGVLLVTMPAHGDTLAFALAAALLGVTLGGFAGLNQTAAVEAVAAHQAGASIGYNMLLISLGTVLGPALFGIGVEWIGYPAAWTSMAALLLIGAALLRASVVAVPR